MPKVEIPPRYRGVTVGVKEVRVEAETVQACLDAVEVVYPGFLELVVDSAGEVRKFVRLFLNGEELSRTTYVPGLAPPSAISASCLDMAKVSQCRSLWSSSISSVLWANLYYILHASEIAEQNG